MTDTTPTAEQIEAGAREAFWWDDQNGHIRGGGRLTFDTLPEEGRRNYRDLARAVLTVALDRRSSVSTQGEAWRDRHGDVWRLGDDGLMHTRETAPFSREHVDKKWGPLVRVSSDSQEDQ